MIQRAGEAGVRIRQHQIEVVGRVDRGTEDVAGRHAEGGEVVRVRGVDRDIRLAIFHYSERKLYRVCLVAGGDGACAVLYKFHLRFGVRIASQRKQSMESME